jgi:MoxR-like ATPase
LEAALATPGETPVHKQPPESGEIARFSDNLVQLSSNISSVVVASESTVKLALLGLFSQGHVLVEDLPGVGKTLLAKTIAASIECDFKRIQFTPDLLPTDITGTSIFDLNARSFEFVPGPIFSNVVLADEINRTGPRTQSALLEAMAEQQVSVDGTVMRLPRPFMVIATQNLAESHGTFPLPDSQKDRFLLSMGMGLPTLEQEAEILARSQYGMPSVSPVLAADRVVEMQNLVLRVEVAASVRQYMVNIISASRSTTGVQYGVSPRGGAALQRAAQCNAAFEGRSFVIPEDVRAVAPAVLTHRIGTTPEADGGVEQIVGELFERVRVPA